MKAFRALIHLNLFISLAAVSLTVETPLQLGLKPHWQPYLLFIFFAVLFEYELHQQLSALTSKQTLNRKTQFLLTFISAAGFLGSCFFVSKITLLGFIPIGMLTLLYSFLIFGKPKYQFGIRKIPLLKTILIATVWSASTSLLPVFQSDENFQFILLILVFLERFFFILAIAIPFDIRDRQADQIAGMITFPTLLGEDRAMKFSYFFLLVFLLVSVFHYAVPSERFILGAFSISALSTFLFIRNFRNRPDYYFGILDGTLILQGILVWAFSQINCN